MNMELRTIFYLLLFQGDGTLYVQFQHMWKEPSPLDGLFFVIYAVGSVLDETPTPGNNVDTSGKNNSIPRSKTRKCWSVSFWS